MTKLTKMIRNFVSNINDDDDEDDDDDGTTDAARNKQFVNECKNVNSFSTTI